MFETVLPLFDFAFGYCRRLADDIREDEMSLHPAPGVHPPLWILGHLAVTLDYGMKPLGLPMLCPKRWHVQFGPGSNDSVRLEDPPTKGELLQAINAGHAALRAGSITADPVAMNQPHGLAVLANSPIRTVGDLIAHLMTTHFATHLGQLSVWRRVTGRPPLF
jgi:hypothetical protein